jgi:hypothetical protein
VGGGYRMSFINLGNGERHSFGGSYSEIVPNGRLVATDRFEDDKLPGEMLSTYSLRGVLRHRVDGVAGRAARRHSGRSLPATKDEIAKQCVARKGATRPPALRQRRRHRRVILKNENNCYPGLDIVRSMFYLAPVSSRKGFWS